MLSYLFQKIEKIALAALGIFSLILVSRNSKLSRQNKRLNRANELQNKTIEIQKKVINVAKNTSSTDIDGNIKRMHERKL